MGSFGTCSGCGRQIIWLKTSSGKNMPCDSAMVNYQIVAGGKERIVTPDGRVVAGITGVDAEQADGRGYISHFATCTRSNNFRRRRVG